MDAHIPWTRKYAPKKGSDVVGQDEALARVRKHVEAYKRGARPLIVAGPPGIGKTSLVEAIAHDMDVDVIEINASDARGKAAIESLVGAAARQRSLFMRGRIILVDEVDGVSGVSDRGGIGALVDIADDSSYPIIFTANDIDEDKLKPLRKKAEAIALAPPAPALIAQRLGKIARSEKVDVAEETLAVIARRCAGDMRAAITDLQSLATGSEITRAQVDTLFEREREEEVAQALMRIFKTTSAEVARPAFEHVREEPQRLMLWIEENLPKEYKRPDDLARALEALAEADRFFGRIRRWQYYRYYVYIYDLLTAGIALAKESKYPGAAEYKDTTRPLTIWIYNQKNAKRKRLAEQLAPQLHTSRRRVERDVLPYLSLVWKKDKAAAGAIRERYGLDEDACAWFAK